MKRLLFVAISILVVLSCRKEKSCEGCLEKNGFPVALAGPDQTINLPTDSFLLDGSASKDVDGKIVEWQWTKISGPTSFTIADANKAKATVSKIAAGIYLFELTVKDNGRLSAKDTVQITVTKSAATNHPPVANAGPDQNLAVGSALTLDGSLSSDPEHNIVSYSWSKISGPSSFTIVNGNLAKTQVTNVVQGIYEFELKVTDAGGLSSRDTVKITLTSGTANTNNCSPTNRPPVAGAGTDRVIYLPQNRLALDAINGGYGSSDPDSNIVSYDWTKVSGPATFNITTINVARVELSNLVQGVYQFQLKVTDACGLSDIDTVQIAVSAPPAGVNTASSNVFFYFPDPTGSLMPTHAATGQPFQMEEWDDGYFNPIPLITIKIAATSSVLSGLWCTNGCAPVCPVQNDYNVDLGLNCTGFTLPPGTYNWSAEATLPYGPPLLNATPAFTNFFKSPHTVQGTITVNPGDQCVIIPVVF